MIECKECMYVQVLYSQKVNKARDCDWGMYHTPPIDGIGLINGPSFFILQKRSRFKLVVIY